MFRRPLSGAWVCLAVSDPQFRPFRVAETVCTVGFNPSRPSGVRMLLGGTVNPAIGNGRNSTSGADLSGSCL